MVDSDPYEYAKMRVGILPRSREELQKAAGKAVSKKGSIDVPFLVIVLILLTFGLIMVFSASYAWGFYRYGRQPVFY